MINRLKHFRQLLNKLSKYPVVAIIGARQVGKTTLAREVAKTFNVATLFDLENPEDLAVLDDPMLALKSLVGLVVLDEIQRKPDLFQVLRVLADRPEKPAQFLILGSAAPELLKQSSESLAGRIYYHKLPGFSINETGVDRVDERWVRGGFPRSFLSQTDSDSLEWRQQFIQTFLERDIPLLGIQIPSITLRRFWSMLAHYHGQLWNGSEIAGSLGISPSSAKRYLDILTSALVVEQLQPWHENIKKRQVKSPKLYISDTGILHALLGLGTYENIQRSPKSGASWEGFIIDQIIQYFDVPRSQCFFWATHGGAEIDLLIILPNRRVGFEVKRTTQPKITVSMKVSLDTLNLQKIFVIHAGERSFLMSENIEAVSINHLFQKISLSV